MKKFAMRITYDGSRYHGWQRQKNAVTVQQRIEEALAETLGAPTQVTGCSRTDAGVHARNFVFHFVSDTRIPAEKLPYALNYRLGTDISALAAQVVPDDFHARFSARGKRYTYQIWNAKIQDPFLVRYSWHLPYSLDVAAMQQAAPHFLGTHDFAGFMAAGGDQKTTVRTVRRCEVSQDSARPAAVRITVEADAFLYNMVRIITGTLTDVGLGRLPAAEIPAVIQSADRTRGGMTAPPQGLFLEDVYYEPEVCRT